MSQEFTLMGDIIRDHGERMQNMKRYYPFFRLAKNSLEAYGDGQFKDLDMGLIVMAVLRFFIEENQFKENSVTYPMYEKFMASFLRRECDCKLSADEAKELIQYIFDKLCNDGRPFIYTWYDPVKKVNVQERVKYIDSRFDGDTLVYFITGDAIEFYLDTKEVKDESKITTEQLLLEKMLRMNNIAGALDVVRRINGEVGRLMVRRDEVVRLLSQNIFAGTKALDEFSQSVLSWFKEEQNLFTSNKDLVDQAMIQAENDRQKSPVSQGKAMEEAAYTLEDVYLLDQELKRAMRRHSQLLSACTDLCRQADAMIEKAKISRLRNVFSFDDFLERVTSNDCVEGLEAFVKPLLGMNLHKTLNLYQLDKLLDDKPEEEETGERVGKGVEENYVYSDEVVLHRIENNFNIFLKVLFEQLTLKGQFDLKYLNHMYEMKFTEDVLKNSDYFSFLIHLCQKKHYDLDHIRRHQDTFLEGAMAAYLNGKEHMWEGLAFDLEFISQEILTLKTGVQISNIRFQVTKGGRDHG